MTGTSIVNLETNGIHIELGGVVFGSIKIPYDYVPYTFAPILGQHKVVTGDQLQDGFIVVIEDKMLRRNPEVLSPEYPDRRNGFVPTDYDRASVEEQSRWALVTDFQQRDQIISFTAIYADGTMRSRQYNKAYKWAVMLNFEFQPSFPVCPGCETKHAPDPILQSIEEQTRLVTERLFGESMSFEEFNQKLRRDNKFFDDVVDRTLQVLFGEEPQPNSDDAEEVYHPQPGETPDETLDRLRDEDEVRGNYNREERPVLRLGIPLGGGLFAPRKP